MTKHKMTGGWRAVAFVLAAAMFWGLSAGIGRAETSSVCTAAMEKCLGVSLYIAVSASIWGIFIGAGSCVMGYNFCRKYVAPKVK